MSEFKVGDTVEGMDGYWFVRGVITYVRFDGSYVIDAYKWALPEDKAVGIWTDVDHIDGLPPSTSCLSPVPWNINNE